MEHFAYTMRLIVAIVVLAIMGCMFATGGLDLILAPVFLLPFGIWGLWKIKL